MSRPSPFISVIIPVYNSERTILRTLKSVKEQSYQDYEIIIVDDGSSDDSVLKINSFASSNLGLEIKLIIKENGGVSTARNTGLRIARGTWIALLDSDDEWLPHKLEKQLKVVSANPSIDFLGCNRNGEIFNKFFLKKFDSLTSISSRLLLYKCFFPTPTVIFKKSILETVGYFNDSQHWGEDVNYWIRICNKHVCVLLNQSLVITGGGKPDFGFSGLSSNLIEMSNAELKNMRDAYELEIIGKLEYLFLKIYCTLKYYRRIFISKLRRR
jgi:glycosyltransferase involved in cell wall biosynthesis